MYILFPSFNLALFLAIICMLWFQPTNKDHMFMRFIVMAFIDGALYKCTHTTDNTWIYTYYCREDFFDAFVWSLVYHFNFCLYHFIIISIWLGLLRSILSRLSRIHINRLFFSFLLVSLTMIDCLYWFFCFQFQLKSRIYAFAVVLYFI